MSQQPASHVLDSSLHSMRQPNLTRDERTFALQRQHSTFTINKLKKVSVSVNGGNDNKFVHFSRISHRDHYYDTIIEIASKYRKPFVNLKIRTIWRNLYLDVAWINLYYIIKLIPDTYIY